ncbi:MULTISPECIES: M20/M25/M40 family metallo-hydrolase [unclassified Saccharopolyspora]|uniref:M20/M25/M40 family metallo-hydrolase n=1 Tax=unclassified Saccharopolyspora TaxID=2646250 RepID=UPI001CD56787|nr:MULTISPECIES: M20/M25/M40 family metallo-hydrolase [unclassified Saccharopolyspora]MCA1189849.1 M20/M25/M40 family metallo-hydrolase [Saccharopolyspora sp. 6T]MCA1229514.1 M20/M25/M40 family metallo-hydrolase [Saccharopolyspora sp. 6M]MCA1283371.1 M20/M25/M40 family metallo-hydrolase [Saccharopolyspora sp. 7B]
MDRSAVRTAVEQAWQDSVLPSLSELVRIPAVSPAYDAEWESAGQLDAAIAHVREWITAREIPGVRLDVVRLPERTPLLLVDVPATEPVPESGSQDTVLLYGHLDKQPPVGGWSEGLDPWTPVVRDGRLYGRGSVDDGYAPYAAITAIEAIRAHGGAHARCVLLLETGEESGSPDMAAYLEHLADRLGAVSLVVCLDSGAADYERMWLTTSLRGDVRVGVQVRVLDGGQHSGTASGIVPSSFRVLRALLDRIEDSATGEVLLPELNAEIPANRVAQARAAVEAAPGLIRDSVPAREGMRWVSEDEVELALNNTWRPTVSVIGAEGLPSLPDAGNVLRPQTTLALSVRTPPTTDPEVALAALRAALSTDVPYGAEVTFPLSDGAAGWNAPDTEPWLETALDAVSEDVFGAPWATMGLGGSIPLMGLLQGAYPDAQFVVTGALGPGSNAHVPDESLHLEFAAKITTAIAYALDAHARR